MKRTNKTVSELAQPPLYAANVRFNWRPESIAPYESAWSLINKFVHLNQVSIADVARLLVRSRLAAHKYYATSSIAVASPCDLDPRRLQWLFKLSGNMVDHAFVDAYRYPLQYRPFQPETVADDLRYCPICIARGYHTPLFQLLAIAKCPIHREPLKERCPRCNRVTPYCCGRLTTDNPYGCACGYKFSVPSETGAMSALSDDESRQIERFVHWRQQCEAEVVTWEAPEEGEKRDCPEVLNRLSYAHELSPIEGWSADTLVRSPGVAQSAVTLGRPVKALTSLRAAGSYRKDRSFKRTHDIDEESLNVLCEEFYVHYRSLRRYIQRRLLRAHRGCVIRRRAPGMRGIHVDDCAWISAFDAWKTDWVGDFRDPQYCFDKFKQRFDAHKHSLRWLQSLIRAEDRATVPAHQLLRWVGSRWFVLLMLLSFYSGCERRRSDLPGPPALSVRWEPADTSRPHVLRWWSVPMMWAMREAVPPSAAHLLERRDTRKEHREKLSTFLAHLPRA